MYSHTMLGDACLMASDHSPGMPAQEMASVSVNHPVVDPETGRKLFDALSDGGTVMMPYERTFFSQAFGMVTDRFGTSWMIDVLSD